MLFQGSRDSVPYGHLGNGVLLLLLCCRPWHHPQPHGYAALGTRAAGGEGKSLWGQSQALRRHRLEGEPMASIRTLQKRTWMCGHAQVAGLAAGPSHKLLTTVEGRTVPAVSSQLVPRDPKQTSHIVPNLFIQGTPFCGFGDGVSVSWVVGARRWTIAGGNCGHVQRPDVEELELGSTV